MISTISNFFLTATINSRGAELTFLKNNESNKNYIWDADPTVWAKHAPVLFPIVGSLKNNSYSYKNSKYSLFRHGFARDSEFEIISQNSLEIKYSLKYSEHTLKKYPFKFDLQITYTLINNLLSVNYHVFNLDKITIPFSIGGHPAFSLSKNIENYSLEFETQEVLNCFTLVNDLLSDATYDINLIDKKMLLSSEIFENDALIFKKLKSKFIILLENEKPLLKIKFNDFENLGIWTKNQAQFICIEPWLGYSDFENASGNLFEKEGIQILEQNKSFQCSYSLEIL